LRIADFKLRIADCGSKTPSWHWRKPVFQSAIFNPQSAMELRVRLGFAQAGDALALLPLAAFLENLHAFKTFHDIALGTQVGGSAQASML
jgi:hypothetical protein